MDIIMAIMVHVKGGSRMISYSPLWETMAKQGVTTYTLRVKHNMSHATVQRLKANMPVSTHTLDKLCRILNCPLENIACYVPDEEQYPTDAFRHLNNLCSGRKAFFMGRRWIAKSENSVQASTVQAPSPAAARPHSAIHRFRSVCCL